MEYSVKSYNVFISYGRGDDNSFVDRLYQDLSSIGYKVWYDRESLDSNGMSFLQNIRDALAKNPLQLIFIIGPHSVQSAYVTAEWQFALENCQVIIPVLRTGIEESGPDDPIETSQDFELLPEPLKKRKLHCIDFRMNRNYTDAFKNLVQSLANSRHHIAALYGVINKPNNYIPREQEVELIKEAVLQDSRTPTVVTSAGKATAVQGMGGIGKSVIAAAICQDCDIRRSFEDGIYWLTFGQNPDLQKALQYLTKDESINTRDKYTEARDKLNAFLQAKNCLIVLDDIWNQEHIEIFVSDVACRSRLLITTRNRQAVRYLTGNTFEVDLLSKEDALVLLAKSSNQKLHALPSEAAEIIAECGHLPLAISMIGGMIKAGDENTWKYSLAMLREADLEEVAQRFPNYPYPDLFKAIEVSINSLTGEDRHNYLQLGVFKEDTRIPEEMIHLLWKTEGWKEYHTHKLINSFTERSILQRIGSGVYGLHDLQLDYIRRTSTNLGAVHQHLINNLGNPLTLPILYAWNNYIWHLKKAGQTDAAFLLLQNFDWIEAKLFASNINELLKDYEHFTLDENTGLIYRTLKLSSTVLATDKNQLPTQLVGRLSYFADKAIGQLYKKAELWKRHPWLKPVKSSLNPPGILSKILIGHTNRISTIQIYNNKIISASWDETVRIWDIKTGECLQTLQGHTSSIDFSLIHGEKFISRSYDKILVWDIETGLCIQTVPVTGFDPVWIFENNILTITYENSIQFWDIATGECKKTFDELLPASSNGKEGKYSLDENDAKRITSLAVYNNWIISGSKDGTICIWDTETGHCIRSFQGHRGGIQSLWVHGNKLISVSIEGSYILANNVVRSHPRDDNSILIWDIKTGECLQTLFVLKENLLLVYDGMVITASSDTIRIRGLASNSIRSLSGHTSWITALTTHEDKLISASNDATIRIWDIATGECLQTLNTGRGKIDSILVQDNKIIGASGNAMYVWEIESTLPTPQFQNQSKTIGAFLVQHNCIFTRTSNRSIQLLDVETGKCFKTIDAQTDLKGRLLIYKDKIISATQYATIRVYDIPSGTCIHKLEYGTVDDLLIYDNTLISCSGRIDAWDIESGERTRQLNGYAKSLTMHGDKMIGYSNEHIDIVDLISGNLLRTFHFEWLHSFCIQDHKIITGAKEKTNEEKPIKIWDMDSGTCLKVLHGHSGWVTSLLMYDNKLISASEDSTVRLWDIETGSCIKTLEGHSGKVTSLSKYNDKIISTDSTGLLMIHHMKNHKKVASYYSDTGFTSQTTSYKNKVIALDTSNQLQIIEVMDI
jgi:WD40 repeat protein